MNCTSLMKFKNTGNNPAINYFDPLLLILFAQRRLKGKKTDYTIGFPNF